MRFKGWAAESGGTFRPQAVKYSYYIEKSKRRVKKIVKTQPFSYPNRAG
jgi:hypothetical protein